MLLSCVSRSSENIDLSDRTIIYPSGLLWCYLAICFGPPLLLFPFTYTVSILYVVSFPSSTWPCHRIRFCPRKVVIGSVLAPLQLSSLFMSSFFVLLLAHLSIPVSVVCRFLGIFCVNFPAFIPPCHCWLYCGFVYVIVDIDRHLLIVPSPSVMLSAWCGVVRVLFY